MARTKSTTKAESADVKRTTYKTALNIIKDGQLVYGTNFGRAYGAGPVDAFADLIGKVIKENPTVGKVTVDRDRSDQFGAVFVSEDMTTEYHVAVVFAHNQCAVCGATPQKAHDWCPGCTGQTGEIDLSSAADELFGEM